MTSLPSLTSVWAGEKELALTDRSTHRHKPSSVSAGFVPPSAVDNLVFGPIALAAAIARTSTLLDAPFGMLARWRNNALSEIEWLIEDGRTFTLSRYINSLADSDRTSFAGRVGAGVADLYMNALGYVWRDNAMSLSNALDPRADFIYGGGNASGYGVVLAEAHGSFAADVSAARIKSRAKQKYLKQVRPYVAATSSSGLVLHGYSVAFGSRPGATGAFLCLAETRVKGSSTPFTPTPPPRGSTAERSPTSLALATYRSNFSLMVAQGITEWIDWARGSADMPDVADVPVARFNYAGRSFLLPLEYYDTLPRYMPWWLEFWDDPQLWRHIAGLPRPLVRSELGGQVWLFAIEESIGRRFLNGLSRIVQAGREQMPPNIEVSSIEPIGVEFADRLGEKHYSPDYTYALFRDGLGLLGFRAVPG